VTNYDSSGGGSYGIKALAINDLGHIFLLGDCRLQDLAEIPNDKPLQLNGYNTQPDAANFQLGTNTACTNTSAGPGLYGVLQPVLTVVDKSGNFLYGSLLAPGESHPGDSFHTYGLAVDDSDRAFIFGTHPTYMRAPLPVTPTAYQTNCLAVCYYVMVLDTTQTGTNGSPNPNSLTYSSYLWQSSEPEAQIARLRPNGALYLASELTTYDDFPETQPIYPYPPFAGQATTDSGIQVARFDLDATIARRWN